MNTKRTILLLISLIYLSSPGFCSDFNWLSTATKRWKTSAPRSFWNGEIKAEVLEKLDSLYEKSPQAYLFYSEKGKTYVFISCTFDLYLVNGANLILQYNYFNNGYTCASTPFARENNHYLISGYAFWANHLDLMQLDQIHGSWEYIKTSNQPINYKSNHIFQNSKGIFALMGTYYNPRDDINKNESNGYFLDWKTKTWKKIKIEIEGIDLEKASENSPIQFLETKDYTLMASNSDSKNLAWNVINKETGKIYYFNGRNMDIFLSPFVEILGNKINYESPNGHSKSVDLNEILKKSLEVGKINIIPNRAYETPSPKEIFYVSTILLLGLLLLFRPLFSKKTPQIIQVVVEEPIRQFIDMILPYSGKLLNTESLDKILEIDNLENFDSKRIKRSRLITEINKQYLETHQKELIIRGKNPEDRRYVYYQIQA
jgi:hypothetical protein